MLAVAPFSWTHLGTFNISWVPLLLSAAALALYVTAARRVGSWPRVRVGMFVAGILVTFLATETVIGYYDTWYFSDHMIEHLLLIMGAGPLFALAAPLELARQVGGKRAASVLDSWPMQIIQHPLFGFGAYAVFVPLTHLTDFYDVMLEHPDVLHLEQFAFIVVGYLFFRHAFGLETGVHLHPGLRGVYVMAAVPVDTFTGLTLNLEARVSFTHYRQPGHPTPHGELANVHLGGSIMWIGGDAFMLLALIPIVANWVRYETIRTREIDAELDAAGL